MAEHNTSLPVGAAQSFGQAWAPCNGDIGTTMGNWSYGGGCAYPAPYRSFQQNLINGEGKVEDMLTNTIAELGENMQILKC